MEFYLRKKVNNVFENVKVTLLHTNWSEDFGWYSTWKIENSIGMGECNYKYNSWFEPCYSIPDKWKIYDFWDGDIQFEIMDRIDIEFNDDNDPSKYQAFLLNNLHEEDLKEYNQYLKEII